MVKLLILILLTMLALACGEVLPVAPGEGEDGGAAFTDGDSAAGSGGADGGGASPADASTRDAASDGAGPAPYAFARLASPVAFSDAFSRADGSSVGNGWTERADVFAIASGAVATSTVGSPIDQIMDRSSPSLDVEISATFTLSSAGADPSLYVRFDPVKNTTGMISAYRFWVQTVKMQITNLTKIGESGSGMQDLAVAAVQPTLLVGGRYRLYLRVSGSDTVVLEAGLYDAGTSKLLASARGADPGAYRHVDGRIGIGCREACAIDDVEVR